MSTALVETYVEKWNKRIKKVRQFGYYDMIWYVC